jgi:hypothetical protein
MANFAERFGDIVRGMLSLEVNTIVKEGMSATRMGSPAEALEDIASCYASWLRKHGGHPGTAPSPVTASYFQDTLAVEAGNVKTVADSAGVSVIATRIQRSAQALGKNFGKLLADDPDPDEMVQLRKVWEIGTEEVVMQTVLWIDGDATQRVHPAYVDKAHEQLLGIHVASVTASLSYWKSLGDIVVSLFRTAWNELKPR